MRSEAGESSESLTLTRLRRDFGSAVLETHSHQGDDTAVVPAERIAEISRYLRDNPDLRYDLLVDITAVDYLPRDPRFEVVYHFLSLANLTRVRLKARVSADDCEVPTLTGLWGCADWLEREVWDMFGVRFKGHPNLRRILMWQEFEGHPLRKDYPIRRRQPLVGPKN
ncbi:NADH-quinone oxidoreductase subunit C [Candidatus Eisenbacteria bacterium]|uniref:NADH-quinone oxidoreductase subunit C n=1 Tax=Eiseniibacteriota bacterium TaxID=2212470 RepID=A0ABV6YJA2_UNCEI